MGADNYAALASLPALDPPPAAPPFSLGELLERAPPGRAMELTRCILLGDDLLQREAVMSGEMERPEPAVLSLDQATGAAPLPEFLTPGEATVSLGEAAASIIPADTTWSAYYRHAGALAVTTGSRFLLAWARADVTLRNGLATARARALGLDPAGYLVAQELEEAGPETDAMVAAWSGAPDPLEGLRSLLAARWAWVERHEPWFTFRDDELAAYAAKLVLLHRWGRAATAERGAKR